MKTKRGEALTDKRRRAIPFGRERLDADDLAFVRAHTGALAEELEPAVRVEYRRVALFHPQLAERLTIDYALEAAFGAAGEPCCRSGAAGEVGAGARRGARGARPARRRRDQARAGGVPRTAAMRALSALGVRERSLSKYCAAVALLAPGVRDHRLRPDLRSALRSLGGRS